MAAKIRIEDCFKSLNNENLKTKFFKSSNLFKSAKRQTTFRKCHDSGYYVIIIVLQRTIELSLNYHVSQDTLYIHSYIYIYIYQTSIISRFTILPGFSPPQAYNRDTQLQTFKEIFHTKMTIPDCLYLFLKTDYLTCEVVVYLQNLQLPISCL